MGRFCIFGLYGAIQMLLLLLLLLLLLIVNIPIGKGQGHTEGWKSILRVLFRPRLNSWQATGFGDAVGTRSRSRYTAYGDDVTVRRSCRESTRQCWLR